MAAIDLSGKTNCPFIYRQASVGTTWQEFKLPYWATKCTIAVDAAVSLGVIGEETPADGGAVGSHYVSLAADSVTPILIRDPDDNPTTPDITRASSVFVASATGTVNVSIILESGRD